MPRFVAYHTGGEFHEDGGLGKGTSFLAVQELEKAGTLLSFEVVHDDGMRQGVDLTTGELWCGGERFGVDRPETPLRLIYYKNMFADVGNDGAPTHGINFVAVGWQTTKQGSNLRLGTRVYPNQKAYDVGSEL